VIGSLQAWQQKHSGCHTAPMQLKNLPWPISALQPAQILQASFPVTGFSLWLFQFSYDFAYYANHFPLFIVFSSEPWHIRYMVFRLKDYR
jgi:hypothetical protein